MVKIKLNFFLDIILAIVFLMLMEPLFSGISIHEWVGLFIGVAFIIHILFHWRWINEVTKRYFNKLPSKSRINYILDILLLIGVTLCVFSGMEIAKTIDFSWLGLNGNKFTWMQIHIASASLTLVVIAVHIGLHWKWVMGVFKRITKQNTARTN